MFNKLLILVFYLLSCSLRAETLLEIYQLAEQQDPQLKIVNQERLAILEKQPQARALLLPQVTLGGSITENWRTQDWMHRNSSENTSAGYNVSLNYALYQHGRQIQLEQVDSQISQAEANYENAKQQLLERVAERYFAVLAAHDNLKFAGSAKKAFRRQWEQAQQRFDVGLIAITDVQEARAGYDLAVAEEIQAQNELDNAIEALREITGHYHRALASLNADAPLLDPQPKDVEAWTEIAFKQNPQLQAAQYAVETARQEIEKQRAAQLPTVDLVGQHRYGDILRGDEAAPNTLTTENTIGVQLNYFLYEGGAIRSRVREAKQRHIQALEQMEQQRRNIELQTRQAFLTLLANISRAKALKQALISTETALKAIKIGFESGTRTSVDVVNAQRDLLAAQRDYARARYDYILNTLRLKQAVGILNVQDLEGINNWLVQYTIELQEEEDNSPLVDTENPLPEPAVTQPDSTITPNEPTP
jgi:outer membrane protein